VGLRIVRLEQEDREAEGAEEGSRKRDIQIYEKKKQYKIGEKFIKRTSLFDHHLE
jgi:hypothetical protein